MIRYRPKASRGFSLLGALMMLGAVAVPSTASATAPETTHVTVPANSATGVDTELVLTAGARIDITATGTANWAFTVCGSCSVGPDGFSQLGESDWLAPGLKQFSLVGKVGLSDTWLQLGVGPTTITPTTSGTLYLAFNDLLGAYGDNTGAFEVMVSVTPSSIVISSLARDQITTTGDGSYYSIPRPGSTNTLHRSFDVTYSAPTGAQITNVRLELVANGVSMMTILNEGIGARIQRISDGHLRVQVTMSQPSTIGSQPPPFHNFNYRFTLTANNNGSTLQSPPKDSEQLHALWRMPDGFARYPFRDAGGDDWTSKSAYEWLIANATLITRINDISGEHGRNIDHDTHARGTDIDMYHIRNVPSGSPAAACGGAPQGDSGGANYYRLVACVAWAAQGRASALNELNTWALQTRARFDALIANTRVAQIKYAVGSREVVPGASGPVLDAPRGWAESLLESGQVTVQLLGAPRVLQLPAGGWANANHSKTEYDEIHNSHVHIDLLDP